MIRRRIVNPPLSSGDLLNRPNHNLGLIDFDGMETLIRDELRAVLEVLPRVEAELSTGKMVAIKAHNTAEGALRERNRRRNIGYSLQQCG